MAYRSISVGIDVGSYEEPATGEEGYDILTVIN